VVQNQSIRPPALSISDARPRRRLDSVQDSRPRLTGVGMIVGTVAYLAPEAALGMDAVDARADLYALGLVLYQMLAGAHPFDADNDAALFACQRFTPPPPLAERSPGVDVPAALEAVVMRLLEKDPAARYPTGEAVVEAIDAAMGSALPAPLSPPAPASSRSYWAVAVGAGAVALGVAAALIFNAFLAGPRIAVAPAATAITAAPRAPAVAAPSPSPSSPAPSAAVSVAPPAPASAPVPDASAAPSAALDAGAATVAAGTGPEAEGASGQRTLLLRALRVRDFHGGEAAFLELAARDPSAFHEADMAMAARDLAVALDREGQGDRIFEALTDRLGTDGLDVLYDLVATKGKAGAALRAGTVLRRRAVLARASREMRVAFTLREAPCADKLGLLDRAAAEGDGRALVVLQTQGMACFKKHNRAVQEAMAALRTRLHRIGVGAPPPAPGAP
jgi:hypothetical protein